MKVNFKIGIVAIMIAISTATLFYSCKKAEQLTTVEAKNKLQGIPNCNATVENGILHFNSKNDMNTYLNYIDKCTPQQILALEQKNNFVSYQSAVENVLKAYSTLANENQLDYVKINNFREKNNHTVQITDSSFKYTIEGLHNQIVNENGWLMVDDMIYKYEGLIIYRTSIDNK